MKYKTYEAVISYSDEDNTFVGEVINAQDILVFDGADVGEVTAAFHQVVDDYLADCAREGKCPNKPFSGQFVMRISQDLHRQLFLGAKKSGKSLNSFVAEQLKQITANFN